VIVLLKRKAIKSIKDDLLWCKTSGSLFYDDFFSSTLFTYKKSHANFL